MQKFRCFLSAFAFLVSVPSFGGMITDVRVVDYCVTVAGFSEKTGQLKHGEIEKNICQSKIQSEIENAGSMIFVFSYLLRDYKIADSLIKKKRAGARIVVFVDRSNVFPAKDEDQNKYREQLQKLIDAEIPVFFVDMKEYIKQTDPRQPIYTPIFHHKTMVLTNKDEKEQPMVISGSYNFTYAASASNSEDVSFIRGAEIAYHATGAIRHLIPDDKMFLKFSSNLTQVLSSLMEELQQCSNTIPNRLIYENNCRDVYDRISKLYKSQTNNIMNYLRGSYVQSKRKEFAPYVARFIGPSTMDTRAVSTISGQSKKRQTQTRPHNEDSTPKDPKNRRLLDNTDQKDN